MASLDSILTRQALGKGIVRQVTNDLAVGLRLRYIGTGTVTSVTATQATSVVLVTSDGGTDTYLFSSYATLGALSDAINADAIFESIVVDALRSEDPDDFFVDGAVVSSTDLDGITVWDLIIDTSAAATFSCLLSPTKPRFDQPEGHRVSLTSILYYVDNTAAIDGLTVWQRNGTVESELFHMLNMDVSETEVDFANGQGEVTADIDTELIVQIDGTVANHASNSIRLTGKYE